MSGMPILVHEGCFRLDDHTGIAQKADSRNLRKAAPIQLPQASLNQRRSQHFGSRDGDHVDAVDAVLPRGRAGHGPTLPQRRC